MGLRGTSGNAPYDAIVTVGSVTVAGGSNGRGRGVYAEATLASAESNAYAVGAEVGVRNSLSTDIPDWDGSLNGKTIGLAVEGGRLTSGNYNTLGIHISGAGDVNGGFWRGIHFDATSVVANGIGIDLYDIDNGAIIAMRFRQSHYLHWLIGSTAQKILGVESGSAFLRIPNAGLLQFVRYDGAQSFGAWDSSGRLGVGTISPTMPLDVIGRVALGAPSSAPTDSDLSTSQISVWLDETNNKLKFRVKYAGGTLKTGEVALT